MTDIQIWGKYCPVHPGVPTFMQGNEEECLECDREFWNGRKPGLITTAQEATPMTNPAPQDATPQES